MSQVEVERLLGRLITDAEFRKKASDSLAGACFDEGFALSDDELWYVGKIDFSRLSLIAEELDDSILRT